jgi:hypothetical protein
MSLVFAEEMKTRGPAALDFLLYPKLLRRGLSSGVNATEFPLLNLATGPLFLAGPRPGVFLSCLLVLALNLWAAARFLPRLLEAWGAPTPVGVCLLLWFGIECLSGQSAIFMPEGAAFPLTLMGVVHLLDPSGGKGRIAAGAALCGIGLAVKPTMVLVLGAAAFLPLVREGHRRRWIPLGAGFLLSLVLPAWWYGFHAARIRAVADGPQYFAPATFSPLAKFAEVGWADGTGLVLREALSGQFPLFTGWLFLIVALLLKERRLVGLYLLSLVAVIGLDGRHLLQHQYYFMGSAVFTAILVARMLGAARPSPALRTALLLLLCWGVAYNVRVNAWNWARSTEGGRSDPWALGAQARALIPVDAHLVTDDGDYPHKMLLIGRSGSTSEKGPFAPPCEDGYLDRRLAIVSETAPPPGAFPCGRGIRMEREVSAGRWKWRVTLVEPREAGGNP